MSVSAQDALSASRTDHLARERRVSLRSRYPAEATSIVPNALSAQASKQAKRLAGARIEYLDEAVKPGRASRAKYRLAPSGVVARRLSGVSAIHGSSHPRLRAPPAAKVGRVMTCHPPRRVILCYFFDGARDMELGALARQRARVRTRKEYPPCIRRKRCGCTLTRTAENFTKPSCELHCSGTPAFLSPSRMSSTPRRYSGSVEVP